MSERGGRGLKRKTIPASSSTVAPKVKAKPKVHIQLPDSDQEQESSENVLEEVEEEEALEIQPPAYTGLVDVERAAIQQGQVHKKVNLRVKSSWIMGKAIRFCVGTRHIVRLARGDHYIAAQQRLGHVFSLSYVYAAGTLHQIQISSVLQNVVTYLAHQHRIYMKLQDLEILHSGEEVLKSDYSLLDAWFSCYFSETVRSSDNTSRSVREEGTLVLCHIGMKHDVKPLSSWGSRYFST